MRVFPFLVLFGSVVADSPQLLVNGRRYNPTLANVATSSCADANLTKKQTLWQGKKLGNLTTELPPPVAEICCSIAQSFASQRSKNSTQGVGFSVEDLGPAVKHKGQRLVDCSVFDYGAVEEQAPKSRNISSGVTPPLPPFPPPPPPCSEYDRATCPLTRCWTVGEQCAASPPIKCHNFMDPPDNAPLCVHIQMNSSQVSKMKFLNTSGSFNYTVDTPPPAMFSSDAYYSVANGLFLSNKTFHQFRYCVQFEAVPENPFHEVAVCVSLTPGAYDLQVGTTPELQYFAQWGPDNSATVVISDNTTRLLLI
mmetsp:Transcript_4108/g.7942  ORF Transcript_4108/g.7942 Transcript_4108/m.7942 type:complete len:309 (+) Transcript_4108:24-950(+)